MNIGSNNTFSNIFILFYKILFDNVELIRVYFFRDFVNLRYWEERDDIILSSCVAVTHSDMPKTKHVR